MENKNYIFSQKLNEIFVENIKLSFVSKQGVIIVTKSDDCYEFKRNYFINRIKNSLIALSDNESKIKSLIEESFIRELSQKNVIDFKYDDMKIYARTSDGDIYWSVKYESKWSQILMNEKIIEMSCGKWQTLFLTIDRALYETTDSHQFKGYSSKPFNSDKFKEIFCGPFYSMAFTESGHLYIWRLRDHDNIKLVKLSEQLVIKKISCGFKRSLLLTRDGDIYDFDNNMNKELLKSDPNYLLTPIKLRHSQKFIDIASHYNYDIFAAISMNSVYYVWGDCGEEYINKKKATEFKSFNDIFEDYFQISYKPIEGKIIRFKDDFIQNGYYKYYFSEKRKIGKGSFGTVFEVNKIFGWESYAIKTIKFKANYKNQFMKELETSPIISELRHQNIVKYFDVWLENNLISENSGKSDVENSTLYIQMELCDKRLDGIIDEIKNDSNLFSRGILTPLGYYIASEIFIEILEGVDYLHKLNPPIIHRDLNPWNIMLKIDDQITSCVKIVDLGLATIHESTNQSHTQDRGHNDYLAPEAKISRKYDSRADIYSLGHVLGKLFQIDIVRDYQRSDENFSSLLMNKYQNVIKIFKKMTQIFPADRPQTLDEILVDKQMWALSENEEFESEKFNAIQELNNVLSCDQNNDSFIDESFVIKLLKKRISSKCSSESSNSSNEYLSSRNSSNQYLCNSNSSNEYLSSRSGSNPYLSSSSTGLDLDLISINSSIESLCRERFTYSCVTDSD